MHGEGSREGVEHAACIEFSGYGDESITGWTYNSAETLSIHHQLQDSTERDAMYIRAL